VPESAQERFQAEIDALRAESALLASDNAALRENASFAAEVDVLTRRVDELTQRVGKSSKNSSMPVFQNVEGGTDVEDRPPDAVLCQRWR
jgi:predicted nuclease with TOPRIM domain